MTIASVIKGKTDIVTIDAGESVITAVKKLAERRFGALPVMDKGQIVGIFSERDVIYGMASQGAALMDRAVGEVMTSPAICAEPDTPVLSALSLMTRRRIRHLPVMDGEKLIGLVSIGDLVKYRIEKIESEAAAMRDYIQMA